MGSAPSAALKARIEKRAINVQKKKEEFLLKPVEPSRRQEIRYRKALDGAIDKTKDAVLQLYTSAGDIRTVNESLDDLYDNMAWWDELNLQVGSEIQNMNELHSQAFYETVTSSIGINVAGFVNEQGLGDLVNSMIDDNILKVTDLKVASQKRVADIVRNSFTGQEEKSFSLEKQIRNTFLTTKKQAKFIARDQTQRNVNSLSRFRQERSGIKKYKWVTSKDNRVRDTHAIMQGAEVAWGDYVNENGKKIKGGTILESPNRSIVGKNVKNVAGGHVGQDYQCRCSAVPILEV